MPRALAFEHAFTSILGMMILAIIAWGSWRFGFARLFSLPVGRIVMSLALLDAVGLAFWS